MGLINNLAYKTILNFFSLILPVVIMPYVYRVLNPESVGYYEYGLSIVSYFSTFGLLGFYVYGLRVISINRDNHTIVSQLFNDLFFLGIITNFVSLISYLLYVFLTIDSPSLHHIMLIFSLNIFANVFYIEWMNEAFEKYKFISLKTIIVRLISIVLILVFVKGPDDIYVYASITVFSLLINNIASFVYSSNHFRFDYKNVTIRKHISPLLMIFVMNNAFLLYGNVDKVILGMNLNKENVAYYSVAQKAISVIYTLLMGLTSVSYPRLAYLLDKDYGSYRTTLKSIINHTMFILFPASIGLLLLSKETIILFAGNQYILAVSSLQVGSIYIVITAFVSVMNYHVLLIHGKEKICALLFIVFGILNFLIDFMIGKSISPSIAFGTTALAELLLFATMLIYAKRKFKLFTEILNYQNLKYFVFSLSFIPIVLLEREFIHCGNILFIIISILTCSLFYVFLMSITKDKIFFSMIYRFKPA